MTALTDETGQSPEVTSAITPELINGIKAVMGVALLEMHPLLFCKTKAFERLLQVALWKIFFKELGRGCEQIIRLQIALNKVEMCSVYYT